jgi:uncharacterized protein DUF6894
MMNTFIACGRQPVRERGRLIDTQLFPELFQARLQVGAMPGNRGDSPPFPSRGGAEERKMPRYFFHIRETDATSKDEEGRELPDDATACRHAAEAARELAAQAVLEGELINGQYIEVTNRAGKLVTTAMFRDAVRLAREG